MKSLFRTGLLSVLALALIQAVPPISSNVLASATTPSTIKHKKRKKHKKNKEVIPRVRRAKHTRKPA